MGTLTGAARVALGPELPPYYTDDEGLAAEVATTPQPRTIRCGGCRYGALRPNIDSKVADVNNVTGGMAGSIICALFLKRFVTAARAGCISTSTPGRLRPNPAGPRAVNARPRAPSMRC